MRTRFISLPLAVIAALALLMAFTSATYADNSAGVSSDLTGAETNALSVADNDLGAAVNDVLSADPEALTFAQAVLSGSNDPATTGTVPVCGVGSAGSTTGHYTISASGNVVLVCHGQFPLVSPPMAVVTKGLPCGVPAPGGGVESTSNSHLVYTPSGQVILVCHVNPSSS
jgi:hypothetical protein